MKKVLVIGSTVVDVIIHIDRLPKTQEDVHVLHQHMSLGGCAYNTSDMIRHFQVPYILFSPVGSGAYGDFVRRELASRSITSPIPSPAQENGCCYCFVENGGERTFISYHGAEYRFQKEWFSLLDADDIDCVYVCGLEIEEPTGPNIVAWLEEHPQLTVYFAPGPRINRIAPGLLQRIFALHPILHLNEEEACTYARNYAQAHSDRHDSAQPANASEHYDRTVCTLEEADALPQPKNTPELCGRASCTLEEAAALPQPKNVPEFRGRAACTLEEAAALLHRLTGNAVIVTLGERGAYCVSDGCSEYITGAAAVQVDTIGAGDSHIGAVIACRKLGMSMHDAIRTANKVAAKVVGVEGALLPDEEFQSTFF